MYWNVQNTYDMQGCQNYEFTCKNESREIMYKCDHDFMPESFGSVLKDESFEVMQFTGMKDGNGKEIYEGDVYMDINNSIYQIFWDSLGCKFQAESLTKEKYMFLSLGDLKKGEVIGNIFENPELMVQK